jgi:diguanylate cyclase (GGDEF)-like protein
MDVAKPKLLIVDDVADNRTILSRRFLRQGFSVQEADGGVQALEAITGNDFDVILLDILMPDLDGIEVLKRIRAKYSPARLPVIMVTAKAENTDVVEALGLGANDYITKPVDFPIALARVKTQVARKHAEEAVERHVRDLEETNRRLEQEIADRKRSQARIQYMAKHDELTGLGNRALLHENLTRALAHLGGRDTRLSLLLVDLDDFKGVNETLGHAAGDEVLKSVAERLTGCIPQGDTVVRWGADEFAILSVEANSPERAASLANAVFEAVAIPYEVNGQQAFTTCTIGIALAPSDGDVPDALLRSAEMALSGAKADGRGKCQFFEPVMNARAQERRLLEADLRAALAAGQLELHYQPLLNIQSGVISGFEALMRWNHPRRGLISPADFIPLAEASGLITALGQWAICQACEEAVRWPAALRVAVNLWAVQFQAEGLVQEVFIALAKSGLPANRLELEITETALLDDNEKTLATLHQLRSMGVRISMDDFGTGYSSLSYLRSFPFDKIKLDQSFIRNLPTQVESIAIVRAVTSMAKSLNIGITAEGVETEEQLEILQAEGCTEVQGFLISRPLPAREVDIFLARSQKVPRTKWRKVF